MMGFLNFLTMKNTSYNNTGINEITCFTWGDSAHPKTWSNVPYFLTKTLEARGIKVNRINLETNNRFISFICAVVRKFYKVFFKKNIYYDYTRTLFADRVTNQLIKKAIKQYSSTDLFISISFSFNGMKKYTKKKCFMFCDWTIEYAIDHFEDRSPIWLEKLAIERQNKLLLSSDANISLFPDVQEYYKTKNSKFKFEYLGNVINSDLIEDDSIIQQILELKSNSLELCFIGDFRYKEGLISLIQAVRDLQTSLKLHLNVIGMDQLPGIECANVTYHGYLDKSKPDQKEKYYRIIRNSKVIINTTPKWAGFSSMLEAMYWCTPIIITPFKNFKDIFGDEIKSGYFCDNSSILIKEKIEKIFALDKSSYMQMCREAHSSAKPYTWASYVDKMLKLVKPC